MSEEEQAGSVQEVPQASVQERGWCFNCSFLFFLFFSLLNREFLFVVLCCAKREVGALTAVVF